jgi:hypothetical protein
MLLFYLPSRFEGGEAFVAGEEVVIDYGLVSHFEFVSFLRHAEVVRVSY